MESTEIDLLIEEVQAGLAAADTPDRRREYEKKLVAARKLQVEQIELLNKLKSYKDSHGGEYFKPLPHQQQVFDYYYAGKKILLLQGGNQLGKTIQGVNFVQANCLGYLPWDKQRKTLFKPPIKVRVLCADLETEILTIHGWKKHNEVAIGMNVLTVNPKTLMSEWQPIKHIIHNESEVIHIENRTFDSVVTPDHRWLARTTTTHRKKKWKIIRTKDFNNNHEIPMTVNYEQKIDSPYSDDFISLMGWIFTEGTYENPNRITIYQSETKNPNKCREIERLLSSVYGKITKWKSKRGLNSYVINGELGKKIKILFPDKIPTMDFIVSLSNKQQQLLYDSIISGDGTRNLSGKKDTFYNKKEIFVDNVQILALLLGNKTFKYFDKRDNGTFCVNINYGDRSFIHPYSFIKKEKIGKTNVWCVSTDNGIIVMRRKKSPFVTGNCADWDHHAAGVIVPKLYEYFIFDEMERLGQPSSPRSNDGWGKKNQIGVEAFFQYKNGSTIELMTGKLNKQAYEGWTGHVFWADEPFEKYIYDASVRGLSEANGVFLFTMTSVDSRFDWILEDVIESPKEEMQKNVGAVRGVHSYKNTYIPKENFDRVALGWDENVRKARLEGGWYSGQGKVWPQFNFDRHVCDEFKIPTDWPVVPMIDFHPCIEQAIGFYAVDKPGWKYVVDEIWEHLSPEEIADEIIRRKVSNAWRIERVFIDPYSKGDNKMMTNRMPNLQDAYTIISRKLMAQGIRLDVALKDKSSGIANIKEWLMGANKMPSLKIFKKCKRHIYEMKKWEIDENGKPSDKDDHMCENIYRYSLTGTVYTDPKMFGRKFETSMAAVA